MSDEKGQQAEERQRKSERRVTVAAVAALVAVLSSCATAAFTLWPELQPDPKTNRQAQVSVFDIEPGVLYGEYLERTTPPGEPVREGGRTDPKSAGELVYIEGTARGFKRSSVSTRWTVYDAATDRPYRSAELQTEAGAEQTLETPADSFVQLLWIPSLICSDRRYFVRVELLDTDGLLLAVADSVPFDGLPPRLLNLPEASCA